ncbi:hypothetical protein NDU88_006121 [Pleurodeles waltl]|uniref:Uncharacterized protein n=1 Tax=Pleurodeles waltl TaxID=8319 RepID=A0AAV7MYA4_PLEWA|nr:hypothetical protein NDU88_006121 [Pleurodeles waltl]
MQTTAPTDMDAILLDVQVFREAVEAKERQHLKFVLGELYRIYLYGRIMKKRNRFPGGGRRELIFLTQRALLKNLKTNFWITHAMLNTRRSLVLRHWLKKWDIRFSMLKNRFTTSDGRTNEYCDPDSPIMRDAVMDTGAHNLLK